MSKGGKIVVKLQSTPLQLCHVSISIASAFIKKLKNVFFSFVQCPLYGELFW